MVNSVKLTGLAHDDEHFNTNAKDPSDPVVSDPVVGYDPIVIVDDSCASATCQAALKLGLPEQIARTITGNGIAAFKHGVPAEKAVLFTVEWQVSALAILDEGSYDLALEFTSQPKFAALNLLGKGGADLAQKVELPAQVEAIRLMRALGIDVSRALKVRSDEEVKVLESLEKDSMPAKAVDAGAPISKAKEFHLQTQIDALKFVRGVYTALQFVEPAQIEVLRKNASLPIALALRATPLTLNAIDGGMPQDCAWNVTNEHQVTAYTTIQQGEFSVDDICAASLAFNSSYQLGVLKKTGNVQLSLPFHNTYAQQAIDSGIEPSIAKLVNNPHSLSALKSHAVPAHLVASFTRADQVMVLDRKLMSHEQAATLTWWQARLRMSFSENYFDLCAWTGISHADKILPTLFFIPLPFIAYKSAIFAVGGAIVVGTQLVRFGRTTAKSIGNGVSAGWQSFRSTVVNAIPNLRASVAKRAARRAEAQAALSRAAAATAVSAAEEAARAAEAAESAARLAEAQQRALQASQTFATEEQVERVVLKAEEKAAREALRRIVRAERTVREMEALTTAAREQEEAVYLSTPPSIAQHLHHLHYLQHPSFRAPLQPASPSARPSGGMWDDAGRGSPAAHGSSVGTPTSSASSARGAPSLAPAGIPIELRTFPISPEGYVQTSAHSSPIARGIRFPSAPTPPPTAPTSIPGSPARLAAQFPNPPTSGSYSSRLPTPSPAHGSTLPRSGVHLPCHQEDWHDIL